MIAGLDQMRAVLSTVTGMSWITPTSGQTTTVFVNAVCPLSPFHIHTHPSIHLVPTPSRLVEDKTPCLPIVRSRLPPHPAAPTTGWALIRLVPQTGGLVEMLLSTWTPRSMGRIICSWWMRPSSQGLLRGTRRRLLLLWRKGLRRGLWRLRRQLLLLLRFSKFACTFIGREVWRDYPFVYPLYNNSYRVIMCR
jgi:hypothetical protein